MTKPNRTTARRGWVLRKLALTRVRQKAWRDNPTRMEAIRQKATDEAKAVKERKDMALRHIIGTWPAKMTSAELKAIVQQTLDYDGRYSSLTYRFSRKGMLRYDVDGFWHNLCTLPASTSLPT
jgi:hypothetical protein